MEDGAENVKQLWEAEAAELMAMAQLVREEKIQASSSDTAERGSEEAMAQLIREEKTQASSSGTAERGSEEVGRSLPWLSLGKGSELEIKPHANDVFREELGYINMVTVFGTVRTGKSYLLNAIIDKQIFGVSAQAESSTAGVEICRPISQLGGYGNSSSSPKFVFVDMEGQGDKGISQDVKLLSPLLIISKAVVLNELCAAGPPKDVILEKLEVMMYAAQCVANRKDRKNLFGCLHIILRDCPQSEATCEEIILGSEDPVLADSDEHAEAMKKRNDIRTAIKVAFESVKVWCLPKIMATSAPPSYRDADPAYVTKIDSLRGELASQLEQPKLIDGRPLTGFMISELLPQVAEAIKSDRPALSPPSLMDRVIAAEAEFFADKLVQKAGMELDSTLRTRLPVDTAKLEQEISSIKHSVADDLPDGTSKEKARTLFLEKFDGLPLLAELRTQNHELLRRLVQETEKELEAKAASQLRALELPMQPEALRNKVQTLRGDINMEMEQRLKVVPETDRQAVQRKITVAINLVGEEVSQRNSGMLFIAREEKEVIARLEAQQEKQPQEAEKFNAALDDIESQYRDKLHEQLHRVAGLDDLKSRTLEKIQSVKDSTRTNNATALKKWARDVEKSAVPEAKRLIEVLVWPLKPSVLQSEIVKIRGQLNEWLETHLTILSIEEGRAVRDTVETTFRQLEETAKAENRRWMNEKSKQAEEAAVQKFKEDSKDLPPCSSKELNEHFHRIRGLVFTNLDDLHDIHSKSEVDEIRSRIERNIDSITENHIEKNSLLLYSIRRQKLVNGVKFILFLMAVCLTMDVLGIVSLRRISCTAATGTENALATMWAAPGSVTHWRKRLCGDGDTADADADADADAADVADEAAKEVEDHAGLNDRDRLAQEAREAWQAAEEEAMAFAKRLNRKEVLRWLPLGTGLGMVGITMCIWCKN